MNPSEIRIKMPEGEKSDVYDSIDIQYQLHVDADERQLNIVAGHIFSQIRDNLDLVDWWGKDHIIFFYQCYLYLKYNIACNDIIYPTFDKPLIQSEMRYNVEMNENTPLHPSLEKKNEDEIDMKISQVEKCINKSMFLIPIMLGVAVYENGKLYGYHANLLLIRPELGIVEHYEPHGMMIMGDKNLFQQLKTLGERFTEKLNNKLSLELSFESTEKTCPLIDGISTGFQREETFSVRHNRDSSHLPTSLHERNSGYCAAWSFFVLEMTLLHKSLSIKHVQQILIDLLNRDKSHYKTRDKLLTIIRLYSSHIYRCIYPYYNVILKTKYSMDTLDKFNQMVSRLKRGKTGGILELSKAENLRYKAMMLIISIKLRNKDLREQSDFEREIHKIFFHRRTRKSTNSLLKSTLKRTGIYREYSIVKKRIVLNVLRDMFDPNNSHMLFGLENGKDLIHTESNIPGMFSYMKQGEVDESPVEDVAIENKELKAKVKTLEKELKEVKQELENCLSNNK